MGRLYQRLGVEAATSLRDGACSRRMKAVSAVEKSFRKRCCFALASIGRLGQSAGLRWIGGSDEQLIEFENVGM